MFHSHPQKNLHTAQKFFWHGLTSDSFNFASSRLPGSAGRLGSRSWLQGLHALGSGRCKGQPLVSGLGGGQTSPGASPSAGPTQIFLSLPLRSHHKPSHHWTSHSRIHCHCGCCVRSCLEKGMLRLMGKLMVWGKKRNLHSLAGLRMTETSWLV